jgi:threonyl-tRNA synthetase
MITVEVVGHGNVGLPDEAHVGHAAKESGHKGSVIAAVVNGAEQDLLKPLHDGDVVELIEPASDRGRAILRHSTAHVLAQAVTDLWPGAKFAIGPAIQDGFYYDFDLPGGAHFGPEDLERIETRMRAIIKEDQGFQREIYDFNEGKELFASQPYKLEIIGRVESNAEDGEDRAEVGDDDVVSVYRNSSGFVDLCRGPHVPSTSALGHFKLMRSAGAYWRGNEKNPQLQRIYGTAWESKSALEAYLVRLEEAERRDHRKLGAELDLFHFPPEIGSGLPIFHPRGALLRYLIEEFSRKAHLRAGYQFAWTPHITKSTLYEVSGHLSWYKEGMFPGMELEGASYYLKPMNCPMHILIYRSNARSYRELPLRLFEFGTVYRYERSGVLHGLARVRGLTQDDSHIFCPPELLDQEVANLLGFVLAFLRAFGLSDFEAELATRPDKSVGEDEEWELATNALRHALETSGIPYVVAEGEGAFYAPKIDVHLNDAIGRRWQVSTIQVDLQMPQRFDLSYSNAQNSKTRPYMVHRALLGSVERFLAILIEHYAGALPGWLSPMQVQVLPVRDLAGDYATSIVNQLVERGLRAEVIHADEPLGARIRRSKMAKTPYVIVVGDDDVEHQTVGINRRGEAQPERDVALDAFFNEVVAACAEPPLPGIA